jgi:formate hydrogenlyase subunit 6/NADH:ubiquinone oxidoreductase subunit I
MNLSEGGVEMAYRIDKENCIACGACEDVCPVSCITEVEDGKRLIDEDVCISCGACADACPVDCIEEV